MRPTDRLGGTVKPQAEVYVNESETIVRLTVHITPVGVSAVWVEMRLSATLSVAGSDSSKGMSTYRMSWMHHHTCDGVSSSGIVASCLWCEVKSQQTHNSNSDEALHYLTLGVLVPSLLSIFTNPSSLTYEGGSTNASRIMDWRELTGHPTAIGHSRG